MLQKLISKFYLIDHFKSETNHPKGCDVEPVYSILIQFKHLSQSNENIYKVNKLAIYSIIS